MIYEDLGRLIALAEVFVVLHSQESPACCRCYKRQPPRVKVVEEIQAVEHGRPVRKLCKYGMDALHSPVTVMNFPLVKLVEATERALVMHYSVRSVTHEPLFQLKESKIQR